MNNLLSETFGVSLFGYFIGSLPVGPSIVYALTRKNILEFGSNSAGATNVARLLGTPYFVIVLLLDAAKSYFLLLALSYYYSLNMLCIVALALLIGNRYSLFLNAQGGKGVATALGIIAFLFPMHCLYILGFTWLVILIITHKVGLASVAAASILLILCSAYCLSSHTLYPYYLGIFASIHVIHSHKSHIMQLLNSL